VLLLVPLIRVFLVGGRVALPLADAGGATPTPIAAALLGGTATRANL